MGTIGSFLVLLHCLFLSSKRRQLGNIMWNTYVDDRDLLGRWWSRVSKILYIVLLLSKVQYKVKIIQFH